MMLSVLILYSIDSKINEYGAVGGVRIDRGNLSTQRQPHGCRHPQLHKGIVSKKKIGKAIPVTGREGP
jgi:hypothetical protein